MKSTQKKSILLPLLLVMALPSTVRLEAKDKKEKPAIGSAPAVMWREPTDIASRDLFYGPGGKEHAPSGKLVYQKENLNGVNPKFDVIDSNGVRWGVKLGDEARPETAAARLVWAVGYFTAEYYYLPEIKPQQLPELSRGAELIEYDGSIKAVRLKRHNEAEKKIGNWHWESNPFASTRQLDGLRIMMELICNTDLKLEHRVIYDVNGKEQRYYITDLGGSFGKAGLGFTRTKGVLKDYRARPLIQKDCGDFLDFWHFKHIPRQNAKWIGSYLAQLSDSQINDAFRAAGFSREETEGYTEAVRQKINELVRL
jgi:hypothetical protein